MRRIFLVLSLASLVLQSVVYANNLVVNSTTTLAQQTSNNTSSADSFKTQTNGNAAAGNVSKLDIHSLLYPGNHTKIYAHFMGWFGTASHMNVGYDSTSSTQVSRQVQDMVSRGIDGVIIDWYGQGTTSDLATLQLMKAAEAHPGFTFAIMIDTGAIKSHSCSRCTPQQALAKHLQYVEQAYFDSPAYMRIQGRPVVTNFDIDLNFQIDWNAAEAAVASDPTFLFQSSPAFTHAMTGGGYSWVQPKTTDYGSAYLSGFYQTGKSHSGLETVGASYKGFNDTLALWGANRIMDQQCGQTWLQTFSKINGMYNSGNQLEALQLVTWNDYEEGTEIESGIDNCVSVNGAMAKNALNWNITGQENTIDHYKVYMSTDGNNLMPLTDVSTGIGTVDMCSFSLASGNYQLFVQAVGKPNLLNKISNAVAYSPNCGVSVAITPVTPNPPVTTPPSTNPPVTTPPTTTAAIIKLSPSPAALKLHLGNFATTALNVTSTSGVVATPITFACSNLPVGMSCAFSPAVVSNSGNVTSTLTISAAPVSTALMHREHKQGFFYASLFAFGMVSFVGIGQIKRKRVLQGTLLLFVIAAVMLLTSCTGMGATSQIKTGANYTITVQGTAGGAPISAATMSVSIE